MLKGWGALNDYVGTTSIQSHGLIWGLWPAECPSCLDGKSLRMLMDTRGLLATLEAVMWEVGALPSPGNQRRAGVHTAAPLHTGSVLAQVTQVEKVHWGSRETKAGAAGGTYPCRRGQSEARNGTVPPGVACQAGKGRGTVAGDAAALWRRETGLQKLFPSSKAIFKGFKNSMNFKSKPVRTWGLRGAQLSHTHEGG